MVEDARFNEGLCHSPLNITHSGLLQAGVCLSERSGRYQDLDGYLVEITNMGLVRVRMNPLMITSNFHNPPRSRALASCKLYIHLKTCLQLLMRREAQYKLLPVRIFFWWTKLFWQFHIINEFTTCWWEGDLLMGKRMTFTVNVLISFPCQMEASLSQFPRLPYYN